ncbi:hypothetical protein FRC02_003582 [Tulasnella sp. 418]|nr:hypothetical protein FRC02_003582 [Tulasnella sp. 418]
MDNLPKQAIAEVIDVLLKYSYTFKDKEPALSGCKREITSKNTPTNVSSTIEELERESDELEALSRMLDNGIRCRIADIRRRRNQLVPISRLPFELLAGIFREVRSMLDVKDVGGTVMNFAGVSSRWLDTVVDTPQLWNVLDNVRGTRWRELALERSKNTSLDLWLCPDSCQGDVFFNQAVTHINRWQSIQGCSISFIKMLSSYKHEGDIDHLEAFSCRWSMNEDQEIPPIIRAHASQLNTLHVFGFDLGTVEGFNNLKSLSFTAAMGGIPYTREQWKLLLGGNPQLEFIHAQGNWEDPVELGTVFEVHLPNLRRLILEELPESTVKNLLSSIRPNFDLNPQVSVISPYQHSFAPAFGYTQALPRSAPSNSLWELIHSTTWMTFQCVSNNTCVNIKAGLGCDQKEPWLTFSDQMIGIGQPPKLLEALTPPGGLPKLKSLTLDGHLIFCHGTWVSQLAPLFPNLHHLVIANPNRDTIRGVMSQDNLMESCFALSTPGVGEGSVLCWPFRELKCLEVRGSGGFEAIAWLIKHRYDLEPSPVCQDPPRPLEILRLVTLPCGDTGRVVPINQSVMDQLHELVEKNRTKLEIVDRHEI